MVTVHSRKPVPEVPEATYVLRRDVRHTETGLDSHGHDIWDRGYKCDGRIRRATSRTHCVTLTRRPINKTWCLQHNTRAALSMDPQQLCFFGGLNENRGGARENAPLISCSLELICHRLGAKKADPRLKEAKQRGA